MTSSFYKKIDQAKKSKLFNLSKPFFPGTDCSLLLYYFTQCIHAIYLFLSSEKINQILEICIAKI